MSLRLTLGLLLTAFVAAGSLLPTTPALAQPAFVGQTLISPMVTNSHLLEMDGSVARSWNGATAPATSAYMLEDGSILRPCRADVGFFNSSGAGGRLQRIATNNTVVWDFLFASSEHQQHHDVQPMPNGNVLLLAWERRTQEEGIAAGREDLTSEIWPTLIVEIEPAGETGGNVVWEWHVWDHLIQDVDAGLANHGVVGDHPELIDINHGGIINGGDWLHSNAIDYYEELDQIVFSARTMDEFYVIDHSTRPPRKRPVTQAAWAAWGATSSTAGGIRRCTTAASRPIATSTSSTVPTGSTRDCPLRGTSWRSTTAIARGGERLLHRSRDRPAEVRSLELRARRRRRLWAGHTDLDLC